MVMDDKHLARINKEVSSLYNEYDENDAEQEASIIFCLVDKFYLSIYNDKVKYVFNKNKNLYENILIEMRVRKRLSVFDGYSFYFDSVNAKDLESFYTQVSYRNSRSIYQAQETHFPKFEPNGNIIEIKRDLNILKNMRIFSDYLLERNIDESEMYSLMLSSSYKSALEEALPNPNNYSATSRPSKIVILDE